jgi:hypothetical protein
MTLHTLSSPTHLPNHLHTYCTSSASLYNTGMSARARLSTERTYYSMPVEEEMGGRREGGIILRGLSL